MKIFIASLVLSHFLSHASVYSDTAYVTTAADKAFMEEKYAESLVLYKSYLIKQGESIQLLSNVGTCYYKLGQWHEANRAFKKAIQLNPTNWEALYSLAVTEKKLGRIDQAVHLFILIFEQDDIPVLSEAAYQQITALTDTDSSFSTQKRVMGGFRIQYGYGEESSYSDVIDNNPGSDGQQVNASADINWYSHPNISGAWNINAFMYHYQTVEDDSLSYDMLSVGAGKYQRLGRWQFFVGANFDYSLLDAEDYLGSASITGSISLSLHNNQALTSSYTYTHTESLDSSFEYEQGFTQELAIGYLNKTYNAFNWSIGYEIEDEETQDEIFDTRFSSLSSLEQSITVAGFYTRSDWQVTGRVNYSYRHFNDDDLLNDGTEVRRIDKTWLYSGQFMWRISDHVNIGFSYHYTDFSSSLNYQKRGHHLLATSISSYL